MGQATQKYSCREGSVLDLGKGDQKPVWQRLRGLAIHKFIGVVLMVSTMVSKTTSLSSNLSTGAKLGRPVLLTSASATHETQDGLCVPGRRVSETKPYTNL